MTWVRRTSTADQHTCQPPMQGGYVHSPIGTVGDLWRCDTCRDLWRIGYRCRACDNARRLVTHDGHHAVGHAWRPATVWQRIRHWRQG